ncbi:SrfA family protein [Pseudocitrobacter cyperus]|uniref:SrfA family protein n=1 Tax=Pseudocitrobacter cyperus TaxID=3112843 RepID=A0ABV0HE03_9ENTR
MAKTLLRSGNLDDFQSVGGGGQAVFDSANQVRETLRLRGHSAIAECLAIPQLNDEGDRVAWYSPVEGSVISWKAADNSLRENALSELEEIQQAIGTLSRQCLQSDKPARQLFGALLEKALQFPGENHLFLVDGKPVISFWGFVNLNENTRDDVLACLRPVKEEPVIVSLPFDDEPEEHTLAFNEADAPLLADPEPVVVTLSRPTPEPEVESAAPAPEVPRPRRRWRWMLPIAAAVIAAVLAPQFWPAPPAPAIAQQPPVVSPVQPMLTATLPLQHASLSVAPVVVPDVVIEPIAKDALVMEPDQLRAGTTRFLDGNWRLLLTMKNAPSLRYQIEKNKGTARLVHGDNVVCRVAIFAGLHQNGELLIKSRGTARCSDGSRFPMPEISCKAGGNHVADCTARYRADTTVPVTFKKIGV